MRKFAAALLILSVLAMASAQTQVRWFVGLGAGTDEAVVEPQEAFVAAYNASQDEIELILEIVDNEQAYNILATQIAAGNAPDIVGPVGIRGRADFPGAWLDLSDLIAANDYDLSDFDPALVEFYDIEGEGQIGLPFAVFPSYLTYNVDLFDEAGAAYPPSEYGEPYVNADGEELPWNTDTLRELAMFMTVDANGNDATMDAFDPEQIVQFGYSNIFTDMRGHLTLFGAGNFVDDDGNAVIPEHWAVGAQWYHDAMWKDYFYPNGPYVTSDILTWSPFQSGNLAMGHTHLWYQTCCMLDLQAEWALAAMPAAPDGTVTAKLHADTFAITKASKNPEAAFDVLTYLFSPEVSQDLVNIYGGIPARLSLQDDALDVLFAQTYPDRDVDTTVISESQSFPDNPNHEEGMPANREAQDLYNAFWQRLENTADFDVAGELAILQAELQLLFDRAR